MRVIRMRLAGIPGQLTKYGPQQFVSSELHFFLSELFWMSDCGNWCIAAETVQDFVESWADLWEISITERREGRA